jgi:hypothetical protein
VHPGGNNATAVLGDFTLPFATIAGAFYGANGLNMSATPVGNGIIEVWPGTVGRMGINPIAQMWQGNLPSAAYDYMETQALNGGADWKLHLKPGVHIKYQGTVNGPYINATNIKVTITSDLDRTSSIECRISSGGVSQQSFAFVQSGELHIENVSIYDEPMGLDSSNIASITAKALAIIKLRNSVLVTSDVFFVPNTTLANFSQIWDESGTSMIEIQDSELSILRLVGVIDEPSRHITLNATATGWMPQMLRLIGSSFVHIKEADATNPGQSNVVYANDLGNGSRFNIIVDDCWFFLTTNAAYVAYGGYRPTGGTGTCFYGLAAAATNAHIYYGARSIHNYNDFAGTPYGASTATWTEMSGFSSSIALGIVGFGLNEWYELLVPRHNT